jgi:formamidopyrimidine-DNA glycosylase
MPELPEVETIRRDLDARVSGRRITAVSLVPDSGRPVAVLKGIDETSFREGVVGARVESVERRGKYLVLRLDTGSMVVVHLRMTGVLLHRPADAPPDRFLRIVLSLDDGSELRFTDIRKFGGLWLVDDIADAMATALGPEPLGESFTESLLAEALAGRKAPVKSIILDQRHIAGVGNIYADEACFAAGIDPRRTGASLTPSDVKALHEAVRQVLLFGVESRGASFRDYQDADGKAGNMQMYVKVFRRTGKPCYTCGTAIERTRVGGRSTHYCPQCQK